MNHKNTPRSNGSPQPKKRSARPKGKRKCRIRDWHDYDTALVRRGSLTLWLQQGVLEAWRSRERTGKRGRPRFYTDQAIACALRLREVYHPPLRAAEGLLRSLLALLGADAAVPCYSTLHSTLSRRQAGLAVALDAPAPAEPLHLAVDQNTGYVRAAATTTNNISGGQMLPGLLGQVEQAICQVSADGGYDRRACYQGKRRARGQSHHPAAFLSHGFAQHHGEALVTVRVRFPPYQASGYGGGGLEMTLAGAAEAKGRREIYAGP